MNFRILALLLLELIWSRRRCDGTGEVMKRWREWRRKKREEKAASRRSKEIDKQLKAWAEEGERSWKIHLLGQRNSGRSTFLKQIRLLHEPGWFSDERRFSYRTVIYSNILQLMTSLIRQQELLRILLSNPKNEDYKQEVIKTEYATEVKPFFLYVEALKSLWEDEGIQMTLKHTAEVSFWLALLPSSSPHAFQPSYVALTFLGGVVGLLHEPS